MKLTRQLLPSMKTIIQPLALSLLALPVIPELRLSGQGLLDVQRMQFIPVLE